MPRSDPAAILRKQSIFASHCYTQLMATKKNKKTSYLLFNFYIFLGALQAVIILAWVLALGVWLPSLSDTTAVGASLVLGLAFPLILMFTCVLAVITLVGLSIFMFRHKPKDAKRDLGFAVLAISLIPMGFGVFMVYQQTVVIPANLQRLEQEIKERERERTEQELREVQSIEENRRYLEYQGQEINSSQ